MVFRSIFLLVITLSFSSLIYGHDIAINIKVTNEQQALIPYSTVTLVSKIDSAIRTGTVTDSTAIAHLNVPDIGFYQLLISSVGYNNFTQVIEVTDSNFNFIFKLKGSSAALNEVVIQASKPLMQQEDDKTIINTESLEAASTNGYEVIEKTPGLFVDQDGNIYISSTTPAKVYINGKELKMSTADIAGMLKSLPPNAIEKIEILRTPSAKYDASNSGGIVNIVLKKGIKIGITGSATAGYQQGKYNNKFAGFNISNNDGATSSYLNLNYSNSNNYQVLNTNRDISIDTIIAQKAYSTTPSNAVYLGYGINKDFTDNLNLSYDGRLSYNNYNNYTDNTNSFEAIANDVVLGSSKAVSTTNDKTVLVNQDISSTLTLDTAGSEWTNGFTYSYNNNREHLDYNTYSALPYGGNGISNTSHHYFEFQSDLTLKLPRKFTIETGVKATYLPFNNKADYVLTNNGDTINDNSRTTTYQYNENINAAYFQASKTFGAFILKSGLRMENTNMSGHQTVPFDTSFSVHRTDFFPYAYLSRKIMTIAKYEIRAYLVYRRTIARPSYDQLNPFPKYVDQFLSEVGNPNLKPQFSNNYEFNISVEQRPLFAVGYNDTKDMFTNVYYQGDSLHALAYKTYDNVGSNKEFYIRGLGVIPPGGRYFFLFGAQYNHNLYQGLYQGQPLNFNGDSWLFFTYHQLKIDKNSMLTMNGFLRLKGTLQFYELSSFGSLSFNINRKFFNQKLTVTLSLNDAFFTNNNEFSISQPTVNAYGYRETDSRRFGINLRYNFGIRKKEEDPDLFKFPNSN
jgi:iron complex outermembrane receptor protein